MPMKRGFVGAGMLMLIVCLFLAGCNPQAGLELLERTAANMGEAWCRDADNSFPACDPEEAAYCTP